MMVFLVTSSIRWSNPLSTKHEASSYITHTTTKTLTFKTLTCTLWSFDGGRAKDTLDQDQKDPTSHLKRAPEYCSAIGKQFSSDYKIMIGNSIEVI